MSEIVNKYIGITHPIGQGIGEKELDIIIKAWHTSNCIQGIHLWDEVWNLDSHYLICDACGMEIHIQKVVIPDGKNDIIN